MKIFHKSLFYFLSLLSLCCHYVSPTFATFSDETEVVTKVHWVGHGNLVTIAVKDKDGKISHMMVDAGSTSRKKENIFQENCLTPVKKDFIPTTTPSSTTKKYNYKENIEQEDIKKYDSLNFENQLITNIRLTYNNKHKHKGIHIKTVIISHPDVDHYNLLPKLFYHSKDKIDYIIFGGLPESYDVSGNLGFREWIKNRLRTGSKVYFPTIQYKAITSLDEVLPKEGRTYAPPSYTPITGEWPEETIGHLKEAVDFGDNLKVSFMAINPLHINFPNKPIMRLCEQGHDNQESLVIKFQSRHCSGILMGDATEATTTVIENNYCDQLSYCQSDLMLSSHHGASPHGANKLSWLNKVKPKFIGISNGKKEDHPDAIAYENFKQCLENQYKERGTRTRVTPHKVLVGKNHEYYCGSEHSTTNPIFSTLTSKTITITSSKENKLKVHTGYDGDISFKEEPIEEDSGDSDFEKSSDYDEISEESESENKDSTMEEDFKITKVSKKTFESYEITKKRKKITKQENGEEFVEPKKNDKKIKIEYRKTTKK